MFFLNVVFCFKCVFKSNGEGDSATATGAAAVSSKEQIKNTRRAWGSALGWQNDATDTVS